MKLMASEGINEDNDVLFDNLISIIKWDKKERTPIPYSWGTSLSMFREIDELVLSLIQFYLSVSIALKYLEPLKMILSTN